MLFYLNNVTGGGETVFPIADNRTYEEMVSGSVLHGGSGPTVTVCAIEGGFGDVSLLSWSVGRPSSTLSDFAQRPREEVQGFGSSPLQCMRGSLWTLLP